MVPMAPSKMAGRWSDSRSCMFMSSGTEILRVRMMHHDRRRREFRHQRTRFRDLHAELLACGQQVEQDVVLRVVRACRVAPRVTEAALAADAEFLADRSEERRVGTEATPG